MPAGAALHAERPWLPVCRVALLAWNGNKAGRMIRHTSLAVAAAVAMLIAAHGLAAAQAPVATNAPRSGRVNTAAPVFLLPDATRVPLKTLTEGTMVRVEREQGD